MAEEGKRQRRSTQFSGDFQMHFNEGGSSEDEEIEEYRRAKKASAGPTKAKRSKECPGCGATVALSVRECGLCDYQFTSKSMSNTTQSAAQESASIREKFPFEPERDDDGSLFIQQILGRRPRKDAAKKFMKKDLQLSDLSALDAKYDHEYLIKYKNLSYLHVQWLTAADIEAMGTKSKNTLYRYLTKLDKGDSTVAEDFEIDPSYVEVEKIIDYREEEVNDVVDDTNPALAMSMMKTAYDEDDDEDEEGEDSKVQSSRVTEGGPSQATRSGGSNITPKKAATTGIPKVPSNDSLASMDETEALTTTRSGGVLSSNPSAAELGPNGEPLARTVTQIFQPTERCRQVLLKIWDDPYAISFQEPVDTDLYDDYLDVVEDPICLRDIQETLDEGGYSKFGQYKKFAQDMRRVFQNCKTYNLYKSQIWYSAHALSMLFDRIYQAWVVSFSDGAMEINDPLARPWESPCRGCLEEDNDEQMMLCDHCDAAHHIYCLRPPLAKVPEGSWMCPRCVSWFAKNPKAKMLSASLEEEARSLVEGAKHRKVVKTKKKKYLVKWRGLSYRDCTWETVADINDDEKIAEYHRLNDSPPDEPPLTQAEIGIELAKDRKNQLYPAGLHGSYQNPITDLDAQVYAQIRSYHFLKWNKTVPNALLQESGPFAHSYTRGLRYNTAIPAYLKETIEKVTNGAKNWVEPVEDGVAGNGGEAMDEQKDDITDEGGESMVTNTVNSSVGMRGATSYEVLPGGGSSSSGAAASTSRAAGEAAADEEGVDDEEELDSVDLAIKKRKAIEALNHAAKWMDYPVDMIRNTVSDVLSDVIYTVARDHMKTSIAPYPSRPDLPYRYKAPSEIEVCIPKGNSSLFVKVGNFHNNVVVLGFKPMDASGAKGALEKCGRVKAGDLLVAIDGVYVHHLKYPKILKLMNTRQPYMYLRFLRMPPTMESRDPRAVETYMSNKTIYRESIRPYPLRSVYFGVYPNINEAGKWSAEFYRTKTKEKIIVGDGYPDELTAAHAYDVAVSLERDAASHNLNFDSEGNLTANARVLQSVVMREREVTKQRLAWIAETAELDDGVETAPITSQTLEANSKLHAKSASPMKSPPKKVEKKVEVKKTKKTKVAASKGKKGKGKKKRGYDSDEEDDDEEYDEGDDDDEDYEDDNDIDEEDRHLVKEAQRAEQLRKQQQKEAAAQAKMDDDESDHEEAQSEAEAEQEEPEEDVAEEFHSFDSRDSDTEVASSSSGSAVDDDEDDVASDDDGNEWDSDNEDVDWTPNKEGDNDGPIQRLLRAVNESEYPPIRSDWTKYILELAIDTPATSAQATRKIEQIDLASDEVVRVWDSAAHAARTINIPAIEIMNCLTHKYDSAGGFKWKYVRATTSDGTQEEDDDALAEARKEEMWKAKLPKKSKEYKTGGTLRDYQIEGLSWLLRCWYTRRSSILADEMGLGKTVQVVTFLEHLYETEGIRGPFLICVPLSTIGHWKREFDLWSNMNVCIYHDVGGGRDMRDVIREFEWYYKGRSRRLLKFHVLVTTYDDLSRDYEELAEVPWRAVVVDEAHRLRNINSKLLECFRSVVTKGQVAYGYQHRILMTGTPLQNNTLELWSLLNFIEPAKFPDLEKFQQRFGNIQTQEQVETLQRRIAPHLLRRVKEDVAKDIPPKLETIIDVELTTMQKQYYRAIFEHNHGFLMQNLKGSMPKLMNIQMELRKCCNHPFLIMGVEQSEMQGLEKNMEEELQASLVGMSSKQKHKHHISQDQLEKRRMEDIMIPSSGKMVLLDKLLPKLRKENHKVLIFSQMVKMIDYIEEFCEFRKYPCERLDGRVGGNHRQKAIDRFNKDAKSFVFLLSTRAGGVGINLTAADTVIIFDSDWNPQNDIQAMARCHRIGQSKNVTIYRLITRRSFEAEMFERASKKLGLEQALLGTRNFNDAEMDENSKASAKMDAKEMEQLLREGAYAVLLEDDTDVIKEFYEQDIDKILEQRAHVLVTESGGNQTESWLNKRKKSGRTNKSAFTGESSKEHAEIDVNDPDFWKKVLPDLVTPDLMLERLKDDSMLEEDDGGREAIDKFMKDLNNMMEGILDLNRRNQLPERERAVCMKLLLRMTLKDEMFDDDERDKAHEYLAVMEGTRSRRGREVYQAEDHRKNGGGRGGGRGRGRGGRGGGRGRGRPRKSTQGSDDDEDEVPDEPGDSDGSYDNRDEERRGRPRGSGRGGRGGRTPQVNPDGSVKKRIRRTKEQMIADAERAAAERAKAEAEGTWVKPTRGRKPKQVIVESDDEGGEPVKKTPGKRGRPPKNKKKKPDSDDEDYAEEDNTNMDEDDEEEGGQESEPKQQKMKSEGYFTSTTSSSQMSHGQHVQHLQRQILNGQYGRGGQEENEDDDAIMEVEEGDETSAYL